MDRSGKYVVDTMFVIWSIKKQGDPEKVKEAASFLNLIDRANQRGSEIELCVPTPVLTEVLAPLKTSDEMYAQIQSEISGMFSVLPFDYKSSITASRLLNEYQKDADLKKMIEEHTGLKDNISSKIKFDVLIVAIAIAHNMKGIISGDGNAIKTYSDGRIPVYSMSKFMNEGTFFDDGEA